MIKYYRARYEATGI